MESPRRPRRRRRRAVPPWSRPLAGLLVLATVLGLTGILHAHLTDARQEPEAVLVRHFGAQVVDRPAPDFTVVKADGTKVKLSQLRGQVVFVNFWATWCPPCRKEIPDLEKLTNELRHSKFTLLAVSSDDSWEEIQSFFGGKQSTMLVGLDPAKDAIANMYGTGKLPESYVVDARGRLRLRFINVQPWTDPRIVRYLEWLAGPK